MCKVCKDLLLQPPAGLKLPTPAQLLDTVIAECKKRDKEYKQQAIATLSSMLTTFSDIDVYEEVHHPPFFIFSLLTCVRACVRACVMTLTPQS